MLSIEYLKRNNVDKFVIYFSRRDNSDATGSVSGVCSDQSPVIVVRTKRAPSYGGVNGTVTYTYTYIHTHTRAHAHTRVLSLSLSLSLPRTHTHTHTCTDALKHTHTQT